MSELITFAGRFLKSEKTAMGKLSEYRIPFRGLSDGVHRFDFEIGDAFFKELDSSEIEHGQLNVVLELDRQPRLLTLRFELEGTIGLPCDRCLGTLSYPVRDAQTLFIRIGHEAGEQSDNVVVIPENEYQVDVSQYIYEFIVLALPMKRVHPDDEEGKSTCDPFFLERLGQPEPDTSGDPRWEVLRKLKKE